MSKKQFMLYIDESTMHQYRALVGAGNVSQKVEDYFIQSVNIAKSDSNQISIQLLQQQKDDITKKHSQLTTDLMNINSQLEYAIKKKEEEERLKLQEEKAKIEASLKCINCKNIIVGKSLNTKRGCVCNSCFHTFGRENAKEWF